MTGEKINQKTRIELKKLAGIDSLNATQINEILSKSALWITNFYSEAAGDKKVKGDFAIEGFNYGGEFDLSTAEDILNGVAPINGKEPFLFLSDLVNFVEQIRTSLSNNQISVSFVQRQELDKLGNIFSLIGINPVENRILLDDLQRIEYIDYSRRIVERIKLIHAILEKSLVEKITTDGDNDAREDDKKENDETTFSINFNEVQKGNDSETAGETRDDDSSKIRPNDQSSKTPPLKISELDPQAKLYLQSLSIIAINQALSKYFNEASLAKIGLPPGTTITFDQLPLAIRQQLMDRAFSQVENLLLSGQFSLDKLISEPAQRINFSNQAALSLLMDVHGLNLLNTAVREIAQYGKKQIEKNEKAQLAEDQLGPRTKSDKDNVLSSQQAQEFLEENKNNPDFAKAIESELSIIGNENQLDDVFSQKIREITGYQDETRIRLVIENVRPLIEVFIQQGLPPEYLIPNPENFDYNRFVNIFGNSLDKKAFDDNKEALANLIIFYWKRKRAIWAIEVRQELALEKYTPEQAQKLFEEIRKDPQKLAALRNLGTLNLTYGGRQITEELAGLAKPSSPEMVAFQEQQKALIEKYLEVEIAKLPQAEQQKTLKVFFEFYAPGVVYQEYNLEVFQNQIAPQINPMDFYMLQMAEQFGAGALAEDGSGFLQQAFDPDGNYQGTDLLDGALGQTGKKLAAKAIGEGLYLALDAAGGWGEALRAAEAAAPIIKQIKEQLIELGLEKIIEFIKKHWPWIVLGLILAALAALAPWLLLLAPGYFLIRNIFGGFKNMLPGTTNLLGQVGARQTATGTPTTLTKEVISPQSSSGAKTLLSQYSSSAMATAGQAVLATVGITMTFIFIYQTSLNSAFLTDFPVNESEIINSVEKTSKYAAITKTAKITKGCSNPENDGAKCENPSFPLSIEYTITIKPKEDFSIQVTNIQDEIKFKQSQKGWEEAGQAMPVIEGQRTLDFAYFTELLADQVGLSDVPLNVTPTPIPSSSSATITPTPTTNDAEGKFIIVPAGESLTFTYTLDDLSANYNHLAILNSIEVNFYYQNAFMAGTDNMITAARVCLGNCSAGAGCWPTTGGLTQMPYGNFSHAIPPGLSFMDAYDIGCNSCGGAAIYGPPVYAPFDGELCFGGCGNSEGCYYVLSFSDGGEDYKINFLHFEEPNPTLSTPNQCMQVEAGFMIGLMGNRGFSTGVHLHYGAAHGGVFYMPSNPGFSIIETLVPEDDGGNYPPQYGESVTTCY
jgi:hypothetical protein